jgi:cobaltochelatase CobN
MKTCAFTLLTLATVILMASVAMHGQESPPAPKAEVVFLGIWDRAMPLVERVSNESGIKTVSYKPAKLIEAGPAALANARVVYVLNFDSGEAPELRTLLAQATESNSSLKVIPLDDREVHVELRAAGLLTDDEKVPGYWRTNGAVNLRRLLNYTSVTYLGGSGVIEPPLIIPDSGYYHPDRPDVYQDIELYKKETNWKTGSPVAVLLIHQSFWITEDTKVIAAEIKALEQQGFNVATLFCDSSPQKLTEMITAADPDIIMEDRHGSIFEEELGNSLLERLDVPYMRPISMLRYTLDEWQRDPRGLAYDDVGIFMTNNELKGTIEPIVVGGLKVSAAGFRVHEPMYDRIDRFAKRASSWINLQRKKNADKRVALIYYNRGIGKDDLMRGSPTGAFMDAPESMARFLPRLKQEGYRVDPVPASAEALLNEIKLRGHNVGPWAQGDLEAMADLPGSVLVSEDEYASWYNTKLSAAHRQAMEKFHGPPPGKLQVVTRNNRKFIVLPGIQLGNVLLGCLPARGETFDDAIIHSQEIAPPHHYLCFYWWLQEVFKADALVHWGTHGTVELLPGKEAGMSRDDWSDICVGTMPVINPWITDNIGEATISRRRAYAALVDHMPPPSVKAGLSEGLQSLHDDIDKFETLDRGLLREEFRKSISAATLSEHIDETLKLAAAQGRLLSDEEIAQVAEYLHDLYNTSTPASLHIMGTSPEGVQLVEYLVTILRKEFLEKVAQTETSPPGAGNETGARAHWVRARAEEIVFNCVLGSNEPPAALKDDIEFARDVAARMAKADFEISNILRALRGGFVPPGPGPEPVRNPASVPTGRNLFALNPEEIPARAAWEVGKQLVDELLKTRKPTKVGFDLNGMNTLRDYGVIEAQILYLLGVRPVWDRNNLVIDVELIPREELGRGRIDVFIEMGGLYKENFGSRVRLLDKAVRLAAQQDEPDNGVRKGTQDQKQRLLKRGFSAERAELLAPARIFGTKPGNITGTNILHLVPRSGAWDGDDEIQSVYLDNMSFAYTADIWGERVEGLYEEAIQHTDTVISVWASNMTSQLSNHHTYEYLGGLSMAIKKLTGKEPEAVIADVRDPGGAKMRGFEEVLATNLRTELLSPKWMKGMKENEYAGAGHMAELVKNTYGWNVMRTECVSDGMWEEIFDVYVQDKYDMDLKEWFENVNPHAMQEIAATMIETIRKGYWQADAATLSELAHVYAESVAKHGSSGGLMSGGNVKMRDLVEKQLNAPGDAALLAAFKNAEEQAAGTPAEAPRVRGTVLEEQPSQPAPETPTPPAQEYPPFIAIFAAIGLAVLFVIGFLVRPQSMP